MPCFLLWRCVRCPTPRPVCLTCAKAVGEAFSNLDVFGAASAEELYPPLRPLPATFQATPHTQWWLRSGLAPLPNSGQFEGVSCHQGSQSVPLEPHHRYILPFPHGRGPGALCPVSVLPLMPTQSLFLGRRAWGRGLVAITPRLESDASGGTPRACVFPLISGDRSGSFVKAQ